MRRPTRLIAGVFALLAMSSAFAEAVLASTCAPGMDMEMTEDMAAHASPMTDDAMPMGHDHPAPEGDAEGDPDCPFGPVTALQGCAGAASLPAHTVALQAPSPEGAGAIFTEGARHARLFGTTLFRPPRA